MRVCRLGRIREDDAMNTVDPKMTTLRFNECSYHQDIQDLSDLMSDDHTFIDRKSDMTRGKDLTTKSRITFFESSPDYATLSKESSQEAIKLQFSDTRLGREVAIPIMRSGSPASRAIWLLDGVFSKTIRRTGACSIYRDQPLMPVRSHAVNGDLSMRRSRE